MYIKKYCQKQKRKYISIYIKSNNYVEIEIIKINHLKTISTILSSDSILEIAQSIIKHYEE